jgi:molybdate transport system substrate-binding protein
LTRARSTACLVGSLLLVAGCGAEEDGAAGAGKDLSGTLTVLAAASLTETFTELGERFEAEHPDAQVRLAFDSSATLAEQISQGAPADVLATADRRTMQLVTDAGSSAGEPEVFATNQLELVVPAENPARIERPHDIDSPDVDYVVCVSSAPCGALARVVLEEQGIDNEPASEEVDVKAVLSKVELNEADAGIVYSTDATAAGAAVQGIELPASKETVNHYPITTIADAAEADLARAWVDLVLSGEGRRVFQDAGFGVP